MPRTVVIEAFYEFRDRMNCPYVTVRNRYVFENGAVSDGFDRHADPPSDPRARAHNQLIFAREHLAALEEQFQLTRANWTEAAAYAIDNPDIPGPPADARRILINMKARIALWRSRAAELQAIATDSPEARQQAERRAARDAREANRQAEIARLHGQIAAVTLDSADPPDDETPDVD